MGVYYTLYVLPEADDMEYRPGGQAVADVLDVLHDQEWALREAAYRVDAGDAGANDVPHARRAETFADHVAHRRGFVVRLTGMPEERFWPDATRREDGLSRKYDIREDETGIFGPRYCDELTLLWSPELIAVPQDGYRDSSVLCPACGSNPLRDLLADFPDLRPLEWCAVSEYPSRDCRACGAALNLRALAAPAEGGRSVDPAPFAHFLIAIHPAPKATPGPPQDADPQLLERLRDVTGIGFRSIGRYS